MPSLIDLLPPISQKLCIVSDGATGEQKSQAWLMNEVAQRSAYIDSHEIEVRPSEPEDGAAGAWLKYFWSRTPPTYTHLRWSTE